MKFIQFPLWIAEWHRYFRGRTKQERLIIWRAVPWYRNSYLQIESADGAEGESEGHIHIIEKLVVETDILEFEVAAKEINWKFIFADSLYEFAKGAHYYLLDDTFYHDSDILNYSTLYLSFHIQSTSPFVRCKAVKITLKK